MLVKCCFVSLLVLRLNNILQIFILMIRISFLKSIKSDFLSREMNICLVVLLLKLRCVLGTRVILLYVCILLLVVLNVVSNRLGIVTETVWGDVNYSIVITHRFFVRFNKLFEDSRLVGYFSSLRMLSRLLLFLEKSI